MSKQHPTKLERASLKLIRDHRRATTGSPDVGPDKIAVYLIAKERGLSINEAQGIYNELKNKVSE